MQLVLAFGRCWRCVRFITLLGRVALSARDVALSVGGFLFLGIGRSSFGGVDFTGELWARLWAFRRVGNSRTH